MKIREIVKKHQLDPDAFDRWIRQSEFQINSGITGLSVDDDVDTNDMVRQFNHYLARQKVLFGQEQARLASLRAAEEQSALEKQAAMDKMFITSGFNFEGYSITKYSGYISGDGAVSMDRPTQGWFTGVNKEVGADLLAGLSDIRQKALAQLKEEAYALGCNAVIGVDFDYLTLDPETASSGGGTLYLPFLFAVTANGNAVVIEKN